MDWMTFDPAYGLWGLAIYCLLAATILPGGSELALFALVRLQPEQWLLALGIATVANTAGGMISWWCGRVLPPWQRLERLPQRAHLERWGSPALIFSWVPVVGDALCVAAGWLKMHWLPCLLFMALGKFARYWLVVGAA